MQNVTQATDIQAEAGQWKDQLTNQISNLQQVRSQFYHWAADKSDPEVRAQIEHFHNQFHIQLVNLHDTKHAVKRHLKEFAFAAPEAVQKQHGELAEQFQTLSNNIHSLVNEYQQFTGLSA